MTLGGAGNEVKAENLRASALGRGRGLWRMAIRNGGGGGEVSMRKENRGNTEMEKGVMG